MQRKVIRMVDFTRSGVLIVCRPHAHLRVLSVTASAAFVQSCFSKAYVITYNDMVGGSIYF